MNPVFKVAINTPWDSTPELFESAIREKFGVKLMDGDVFNCQCEDCIRGRKSFTEWMVGGPMIHRPASPEAQRSASGT